MTSTTVEPVSGRKPRRNTCNLCNRMIDVRGWKQHQEKHLKQQQRGNGNGNGHKPVAAIRDLESWKQGFIEALSVVPELVRKVA